MEGDGWSPTMLSSLPYSDRVDVSLLNRIFDRTTTSYKYLYFLSLLEILENTQFQSAVIPLDDILLEMLVKAWYPHNYFRLSFGAVDQVSIVLKGLNLIPPEEKALFGTGGRSKLRESIRASRYRDNDLLGMVPFRLLTPFFAGEFKGLKDYKWNEAIVEKSAQRYSQKNPPFYRFSDDGKAIILNHDWILYFYENYSVVTAFARWNWLEYMQRRNPSVPNLKMKLFPPLTRESLAVQTGFWRHVLEKHPLQCLFSHRPLSLDDLSIDHFLPWSFVAHDQLWNMIPVSRGINSSKSNKLPSFERYWEGFVDMQHEALMVFHDTKSEVSWEKIVEPYLTDLRIREWDILDRKALGDSLRLTMEPLWGLAKAQGFEPGWVYQ